MGTDPTAVPRFETADAEVMAAVDDDGVEERLIIADLSREGAWLSVPTALALDLGRWR